MNKKTRLRIFTFFIVLGTVSMILPVPVLGAVAAWAGEANHDASQKVALCHRAGPRHNKTIHISPAAVQAHLNHGDTLGVCPEPPDPGESTTDLVGCKFLDADGDSFWDEGENALPGWTIRLMRGEDLVRETVTDDTGCYEFADVDQGQYVVAEVQQSGFVQTYPVGSAHEIESGLQEIIGDLDFGNMITPVCGNGVMEPGEGCDNGAQNDIVCTAEYGATCQYCSATCSQVVETGPFCGDGIKNGAEACDQSDGVGPDQHCTSACLIGAGPLPVCGNGIIEAGEGCDNGSQNDIVCSADYGVTCQYCSLTCSHIVVTGAFCGDGIKNGIEQCDQTDGVGPNQHCSSACLLETGSAEPMCGDGIINQPTEECDGGDQCNPACQLVPVATGSICGVKFHDNNRNSIRDEGEVTLSGWEIFLDTNGNDMLDVSEPMRVTTESGYCFENLTAGIYTVREVQRGGWFNITPLEATVEIFHHNQDSAVNFGNDHIQEAPVGSICGFKFEDINGDGEWQAQTELGLPNWIIQAKGANTFTTVTNEIGEYCFTSLTPGSWEISETLQPGWISTTGTSTSVTIDSLSGSSNNNFGNFELAQISGIKYEDINNNGLVDEGDVTLGDWIIILTPSGNASSTATSTNEIGAYFFGDLGPGSYTVSEESRSGWTQTYPTSTATHQITVASGGIYEGLNFFNHHGDEDNGGGVGGPSEDPFSVLICKYEDQSGDGVSTTTDDILFTPVGGWQMRIFDDTNQKVREGNTENGCIMFELDEGSYVVAEASRSGWKSTAVSLNGLHATSSQSDELGTYISIQIASTTDATTTVSFYNHQTDISGAPTEPPGGGGGGGGGAFFGLQIHSEQITDVSANGVYAALVTWFSNLPATTRLVYDTVSHPDLGLAPNYGYAFSSAVSDSDPRVTFHSVVISGLQRDIPYYFRPVSAVSSEQWGKEVSLILGVPGVSSGGSGQGGSNSGNGAGSGANTNLEGVGAGGQGALGSGIGSEFGIGGELPGGSVLGTALEPATTISATSTSTDATSTAAVAEDDDDEENKIVTWIFWLILAALLLWFFLGWKKNRGGQGDTESQGPDPQKILDQM